MIRHLAIVATVVALLAPAAPVEGALTTAKCLVAKRKAWSAFRKCEAAEQVKALAFKPTDLAKCAAKRQAALAKADAKAAKAAIACRYRANGDLTVTDYDTGLMWEQKIGTILQNIPCGIVNGPSCVTRPFTWAEAMTDFLTELNGHTTDDTVPQNGHAGYSDWRLPTIAELETIVDPTAPGCDDDGVCIDPIFGPTAINVYWSSSTDGPASPDAWWIDFGDTDVRNQTKTLAWRARAVRNGF